jgi:hypothetical protein
LYSLTIPAYDEDPAVAWECVVKLWETGWEMCKNPTTGEIEINHLPDEWPIVTDENPNHAAMKAVMKMEGVEV